VSDSRDPQKSNNVVSFGDAKWKKDHERKEEKVEEMAKRFEAAFPSKPTPVKDHMRKKKNKKKR